MGELRLIRHQGSLKADELRDVAEMGLVNYVNRTAFETGLAVLVLSHSETSVCCLTILFSRNMNGLSLLQ